MIYNMNTKKLYFNDLSDIIKDEKVSFKKDNKVIIRNGHTGEIIHEGTNKVTLAGSSFTAQKSLNIDIPVNTPSYNAELGLENSVIEDPGVPGLRREHQVILFAVGNDGCGPEQNQVYDVKYESWIKPENLIPFRYRPLSNDLSDLERTTYFGRYTTETEAYYYFKAFDLIPQFTQRYTDGTIIDEDIYSSMKPESVESFVQIKLKITDVDFREYFEHINDTSGYKINSLSLLTAWAKEIDGKTYYQDIRPYTKYHFPNESLLEETKMLDITYIIYY